MEPTTTESAINPDEHAAPVKPSPRRRRSAATAAETPPVVGMTDADATDPHTGGAFADTLPHAMPWPAEGTSAPADAVTEPLFPVVENLPPPVGRIDDKAPPHRIGLPPQPLVAPPPAEPTRLPPDAAPDVVPPPRNLPPREAVPRRAGIPPISKTPTGETPTGKTPTSATPTSTTMVQRRRRAALLAFVGVAAAILLVGHVVRRSDTSANNNNNTTIAPAGSALPQMAPPDGGIGAPTAAGQPPAGAGQRPGAAGKASVTKPAGSTGRTTGGTESPAREDAATGGGTAAGASDAFTVVAGYGPVLGTSGTLRRFKVAVERTLGQGNGGDFADEIDRDLGDPRSWIAGRQFRLQRVPDSDAAEFTIYLASATTSAKMCAAGGLTTDGYTSCRLPGQVVINNDRWQDAVPDYGASLETYRAYAINHEVGHQFGYGHESCPAPGRPAPVMQQQTYGLKGCVANAWPYINGKRYAGPPAA
jgi:hypothetical protein